MAWTAGFAGGIRARTPPARAARAIAGCDG